MTDYETGGAPCPDGAPRLVRSLLEALDTLENDHPAFFTETYAGMTLKQTADALAQLFPPDRVE